jgi:hypothetical protein
LTATNTFNVIVNEVNLAPTLPAQANRTTAKLVQMTVTNAASDLDVPANSFSYTLSVTNLGTGAQVLNASINAAGVITWTPTEAQDPSTNIFVTRVSDNGSPVLSATNNFTVIVNSQPDVNFDSATLIGEGCFRQIIR